jgi:hypothetical protein
MNPLGQLSIDDSLTSYFLPSGESRPHPLPITMSSVLMSPNPEHRTGINPAASCSLVPCRISAYDYQRSSRRLRAALSLACKAIKLTSSDGRSYEAPSLDQYKTGSTPASSQKGRVRKTRCDNYTRHLITTDYSPAVQRRCVEDAGIT